MQAGGIKEWQASSSEYSTKASLKDDSDFGLGDADDLERLESEQETPPTPVDKRNSIDSPDTSALVATNKKRKKKGKTKPRDPENSRRQGTEQNRSSSEHVRDRKQSF